MRYLHVQGSSSHGICVRCTCCKREYVWLRAWETSPGIYAALCRACRVKHYNPEKLPKEQKLLQEMTK